MLENHISADDGYYFALDVPVVVTQTPEDKKKEKEKQEDPKESSDSLKTHTTPCGAVQAKTRTMVQVVDLVPGGRDLPVTDANKLRYVQALAEWKLVKSVEKEVCSCVCEFVYV